jgi:ATP/maltotriose-dependent transcriptional regulator MalT
VTNSDVTNIQTGEFVGRAGERAALAAELDRVRQGHPRLILVEGPSGIGKTALVRHVLSGATDFFVLWASGAELETALPYGVVSQLLAQAACSMRVCSDGDPIAVGGALLGMLGELQERGPVALVVDDVDWADGPSLQALTFALRRLQADQVLTVVVTRDLAATRAPEGLRRLLSRDAAAQFALHGLSVAELRALTVRLGVETLTAAAVKRLRAHTDGNPLYFKTTLNQIPAATLADPVADLPAPAAYTREVMIQLASCSPEARDLVRAASVLGESCSVRHAELLAGTRDSAAALDGAVEHGLLTCHFVTGDLRLAFPHPLTRAAVYQSLGPYERTAAHRDAAALVTDETTRLQHRIRAAAALPDPALTAEVADFARRQADVGCWESAAEHFAHACDLVSPGRERARLGAETVHALLQAGQIARAAEFAAGAETDAITRAFIQGALCRSRGEAVRGLALMEAAWRRCDPVRDPTLAGRIASYLSLFSLMQDRGEEAMRWSQRALDLAEHQPGADLLHYYHLVSLYISGDADRALELAARLPDAAMATTSQLDSLVARGAMYTWSDDLEAARRDLAGVVYVPPRMSVPNRLLATGLLAQAEFRLGRWDEALALGTTVISIEEDRELFWLAPYVHAILALPLAARGDFHGARAHVELAGQQPPSVACAGYIAFAQAWIAAARGDPEDVVAALAPLAELPDARGIREPGVIPWPDLLADAYVSLGRLDEAEAVLDACEKLAGARDRRSALAGAARARGNLYAAQGRATDATDAFEHALQCMAHVPMPFERAKIELAYGAFLRRAGQRSAAAARLTAARDVMARLGAKPYLGRCDQELAACGMGAAGTSSPRSAGRGLDVLTSQEHAVARHVLAGLTNKQIARQMVLSVKTIEYHLGNIYAKLGVPSRTGLVSMMTAAGGAGDG